MMSGYIYHHRKIFLNFSERKVEETLVVAYSSKICHCERLQKPTLNGASFLTQQVCTVAMLVLLLTES
jgi:hypothetical protein